MNIGLGTPNEDYKAKLYYFLYVIFAFLYLFWAWIGKTEARQMISFYLMLGMFALIFIIFDNLTKKEFPYIDSITIERPTLPISPSLQFFIGLLITALLSYKIIVTGQAWVNYPQLQVFDLKIFNAILSGVVGTIENMMFFELLFPTMYAIFRFKGVNPITSFIFGGAVSSLSFMLFHIFVYGYMQTALISTLIFAWIVITSNYFFRSDIIGLQLHFSNNLIATLIQAGVGFRFI